MKINTAVKANMEIRNIQEDSTAEIRNNEYVKTEKEDNGTIVKEERTSNLTASNTFNPTSQKMHIPPHGVLLQQREQAGYHCTTAGTVICVQNFT